MSNSNKNRDNHVTADNIVKSDATRVMLYSFPEQGKGKWRIQDDVVMGGRSGSKFKITEQNYGHFCGRVSLENNGGFCSIHLTVEKGLYYL